MYVRSQSARTTAVPRRARKEIRYKAIRSPHAKALRTEIRRPLPSHLPALTHQ